MKGYKTVIVNGVVTLIPLIDMAVNNGAVITALIPHAGVVLSALGAINILLRIVTNTPVGKSEA